MRCNQGDIASWSPSGAGGTRSSFFGHSRPPDEKQELREISRKETVRIVREVLATYRERGACGRTAVDTKSGRATWAKAVMADVEPPTETRDARQVLRSLGEVLRESQRGGVSGTVTLVVCQGQGVEVEKVVELERFRLVTCASCVGSRIGLLHACSAVS